MFKSTLIMVCSIAAALTVGFFLLSNKQAFDTHEPGPEAIIALEGTPEPEREPSYSSGAPAYSGATTAIPKAADGHFWIDARVNNTVVKFLVDTGATTVALTDKDAQRMGINLYNIVYDREVLTASGPTKAASVIIDRLQIGNNTVHDVKAMVIRKGLTSSLLGMSYLGRLRRFEATPTNLILHP
jgi:aspartyl protease family protein